MYHQDIISKARDLAIQGKHAEAIELLESAIQPNVNSTSAEIWWELAQIYKDPNKKRRAAARTIRSDPTHQAARQMMAQLLSVSEKREIDQSISTSSQIRNNPVIRSERLVQPKLALIGFLTLASGSAIFFALFFTLSRYQSVNIVLTSIPYASPIITTVGNQFEDVNPEFATLTASIETSTGATLVALAPTTGADLRFVLPVLEEAQPRFFRFPILIYMPPDEEIWEQAFANALQQVNNAFSQIDNRLSLERTTDAQKADITIRTMTKSEYDTWSSCPRTDETIGCGWIFLVYHEQANQPAPFTIGGQVRISNDTRYPSSAMLHELLHSLGIQDHSDDPNDVMYPYMSSNNRMGAGDIEQLRLLYAPS